MRDVLNRKQLVEQLERRRAVLDKLMASSAPRPAIEEAWKKVLLTKRRLERLDAAVLAGDFPSDGDEGDGYGADGGQAHDEL